MLGLPTYNYTASASFMDYRFTSNGPNGEILKVARFSELGENLYNFGFGDLDPATGNISDTVASNNGDIDTIMGTLGGIIYDFTTIRSGAAILIEGTSPARTRLYQSQIGKHWARIDPVFEILGYREGKWEPFQKGKNYEVFLGRRKGAFFV